MEKKSLKEVLEEYSKKDIYPFHMPGHKRNMKMEMNPYSIDMTEVEGVDDLHDPEEIILEEQEEFAKLYRSENCFLLVGGSTVGNLAAVYAATNENDKIIIQRNAHKSVYNAVQIRHNKVKYLFPDLDENGIYKPVLLEDVQKIVEENKDAKALFLTSPSYEGYHSPIKEIAEYCHKQNILLIVDQAHGAHLGFAEEFTNSAASIADITVMSLHKTLPSMTQTALLHVNGNRVSLKRVREALDIFETSSPSYVLMNSMSVCRKYIEENGECFKKYVDNLEHFYVECENLKHLKIIRADVQKKDPGKLIISTRNTNISGVELAKTLREKYKIETELSSYAYVIAMTSIMDSCEGFERLVKALQDIDAALVEGEKEVPDFAICPLKKMELYEAKKGNEKEIQLEKAKNCTSAGMICIYPPGAPLIVPGEIFTEEVIKNILLAKTEGLHVTGIKDNLVSIVN